MRKVGSRMISNLIFNIIMMGTVLPNVISSELQEESVLILDKTNFHSVLDENDFVLVNFYAPQCGACKGLAPEYTKAASLMLETNDTIKIAKVNAIEETEIANEYGIDGYPTVRFFRKGLTTLDYRGLRLAESIVAWAIKRTGSPAIELNSMDEAIDLIEENDIVTIGFFEDESDERVKTYLAAAELSDYSVFAMTFQEDILDDFNAKPGEIVLFNKEFEDGAVFDKEFTEREILKFVEIESLPLIMEFTNENAMHVFTGFLKSHLLLFVSKTDPFTGELFEELKDVAKSVRGKMLFSYFDIDLNTHKALYDYLTVTEEDPLPAVRIIQFGRPVHKFQPENPEITVPNIKNFVNDFLNGKLKKTLKSEVLPEDWNEKPVKVLVGDNFESVVKDSTKEVLVEFYAHWCSACNNFAPIYDLIGEHFKSRDDLIIAKIDASLNEFDNKVIESLPTFTLYTKLNHEIDFKGSHTFDAIVNFVESGGSEHEDTKGKPTEDELQHNEKERISAKQEL